MKMINAKITITYTCPMLVKDESEIEETFYYNKKNIVGGFETDIAFEGSAETINWTEYTQVFTKEGIYLDINDAKKVARL
jgi:hypothetical protein